MAGDKVWVRFSGVCGILAPLVAFTFILLAIASYPRFSWTDNALSDLGVVEGFTSAMFNSGLIAGGVLALIFAAGLFKVQSSALGKAGALIFFLAALSLTAIGVFPENVRPIHYYVSVAFFTLSPIALLVLCAAFAQAGKRRMGLFTFIVALFAAAVWVFQWTVGFGANVAIPEALSALAFSVWAIVAGYGMLKGRLR
ncbi:MAG: DUF998 domain-containing protein [Nitrososphaerota archaeon]|nr:DUF998 domain-containing protein [Nitrososphaerota archaeon]